MTLAISGYITKPSRASRMEASATSPKVMVPWRSSAVIQASGALGTTVRSTPTGMCPSCSRAKRSGVTAAGQVPRPLMVSTCPVVAL